MNEATHSIADWWCPPLGISHPPLSQMASMIIKYFSYGGLSLHAHPFISLVSSQRKILCTVSSLRYIPLVVFLRLWSLSLSNSSFVTSTSYAPHSTPTASHIPTMIWERGQGHRVSRGRGPPFMTTFSLPYLIMKFIPISNVKCSSLRSKDMSWQAHALASLQSPCSSTQGSWEGEVESH